MSALENDIAERGDEADSGAIEGWRHAGAERTEYVSQTTANREPAASAQA